MRVRGEGEAPPYPRESWLQRFVNRCQRWKHLAKYNLRWTNLQARYSWLRPQWVRTWLSQRLRAFLAPRGLRTPRWCLSNPPFEVTAANASWMASHGYVCDACRDLGGHAIDACYRTYAESKLEPLSGSGGLTERFAVFCPECYCVPDVGTKLGQGGILDFNNDERVALLRVSSRGLK